MHILAMPYFGVCILFQFSGLKKSLPHNVHILTLEPWKGKSLLLRLEHFIEKGEDHELSKVATVDIEVQFLLCIMVTFIYNLTSRSN